MGLCLELRTAAVIISCFGFRFSGVGCRNRASGLWDDKAGVDLEAGVFCLRLVHRKGVRSPYAPRILGIRSTKSDWLNLGAP